MRKLAGAPRAGITPASDPDDRSAHRKFRRDPLLGILAEGTVIPLTLAFVVTESAAAVVVFVLRGRRPRIRTCLRAEAHFLGLHSEPPNPRMQPTGRGGPTLPMDTALPVARQWKRRFVRAATMIACS